MDKELEMLCKRPWEFLAKSQGVPHHLKAPLGELMEAYIRLAYRAGERAAIEDIVEDASQTSCNGL